MAALETTLQRFLAGASVGVSHLSGFFSHNQHLHTSRFARVHELSHLLSSNLEHLGTSLLLGTSTFNQIACVRPATTRRELGNVLVCAPPRAGKSKQAIAELLTWRHSVIVNDIKGELYAATAGFRKTFGDVVVIDFQGYGNAYDPLHGKQTEDALYSAATHLLFEPHEGEGKVFTLRAIEMLTFMWLAARAEGIAPFPYIRFLTRLGPEETAARLYAVSPDLATQFLHKDFLKANFDDDRFLLSCWGTLTARLRPLLTETVIRSLTHADFTPAELMCSEKPVTVYIRWREQDLLALSPLTRLLWGSIIDELTTTYDRQPGQNAEEKGCNPVLLLIDEGGRTAIPNLHDAASTVCGRGISIWLVIQSLEQLSAVYGRDRANILRGNCETQLYYRPNDLTTARYLEERLGTVSRYARSQTLHRGDETSEGLSERPVPLLSSQDIALLSDEEVIAFHRNNRPLKLKRMDWQDHPLLVKRRNIPPPKVWPLPPLTDIELREPPSLLSDELSSDKLVDPDRVSSD